MLVHYHITTEPDAGKPYRWDSGDPFGNTTYQNFAPNQPTMVFLPGGCGRILTGERMCSLSLIFYHKIGNTLQIRELTSLWSDYTNNYNKYKIM